MKAFLDKLTPSEKDFYHQVYTITGIADRHISTKERNKIEEQLSNQQTYDLCRFNTTRNFSSVLLNKIKKYRETNSNNTCLHIASEYGNLHLMDFLLKQQINSPNETNNQGDTALLHTLKTSNSDNFEKSILLLSRFSDLSIRDKDNKLPFQVILSSYSKSRARIMEILKEQYIQRLSSKQ